MAICWAIIQMAKYTIYLRMAIYIQYCFIIALKHYFQLYLYSRIKKFDNPGERYNFPTASSLRFSQPRSIFGSWSSSCPFCSLIQKKLFQWRYTSLKNLTRWVTSGFWVYLMSKLVSVKLLMCGLKSAVMLAILFHQCLTHDFFKSRHLVATNIHFNLRQCSY